MQSQITKWLLVLLGVLLVCGAAWWVWSWLSSSAPVPTQTQTTANGTQFPSQVSVNVAQGSSQTQTSSSSQSSSSIDTAYAALFSQVGATGVAAVEADASSTGDLAAIYALYAKDVSISKDVYPGENDYAIHVAFADLNSDGIDEALVLEDLPGSCGTEGCTFDIYQKKGNSWNKIFTNIVEGDIGLSNVYVGGYQNLLLTVNAGESNSEVMTYSWNGTTYKVGQSVATWNGTSFVANQ